MAGKSRESTWRPRSSSRRCLRPGFVIEEFEDGRYTVFVPSIPTPFAGPVYVLDRQRVHPVDAPFTDAIRVISRWGSGAKNLVCGDGAPRVRRLRCHDSRQRRRRGPP
jgi:uncharacterized membrane protein